MRKSFVVLSLIALLGCEKQIPLSDTSFEKKIVVNAMLEVDSNMQVGICHSVGTLGTPDLLNFSDSASVLLKKDGLVLWNERTPINEGIVHLPFRPRPGSLYEIQIAAPGYPSVLAYDSVPFNKGQVIADTLMSNANFYEFKVTISDPPESSRYMMQLFALGKSWNGVDSTDAKKSVSFTSKDKVFVSNFLTTLGENSYVIFDDLNIPEDGALSLTIDKKTLENLDFEPVKLELRLSTLSKTLYDYHLNLLENTHIFGGPLSSSSRYTGNVKQGLGAFCFYHSDSQTISIPD